MNSFDGLLYGFSIALTFQNIFAVLLGAFVGTLVGVLPGIGSLGAMALLLPITLNWPPATALIMLAGIYYGTMYGGSTTSILVNIPGEAVSVVTCRDGYQMAKNGRAGAALSVAAIGSFIAGTVGIILVMFFAPALAVVAIKFGQPEFFSIALLGIFALSRISGGPMWHSLLVLGFGLLIATIGLDPISFTDRYTMGIINLSRGIELVPVIMGLYGVTEVLTVMEKTGGLPHIINVKFRELFPTLQEWKRAWPAMLRGTGNGLIWGLLPGPSSIISTFTSYEVERRLSKHKKEFGNGAIEGVAAPEAANNAASSTAMVPLLSLGIPFTSASAILLACLQIQGVLTGPLLLTEHPEIFWGVIASMYVGNIALLAMNLPLVGMWVSLLRVPQPILLAIIMLLILIGAYGVNNSVFDLIVMIIAGLIGYMFRKLKFDFSPLVVALVLGPLLESSLRNSLVIGYGNPFIFFMRPISGALMGLLALMLIGIPIWNALKRRNTVKTI